MYLHHYGFKRQPFNLSADPDFQWIGMKHQAAINTLKEDFVRIFKSFLLRYYATYSKVLIIIDKAQRLNHVFKEHFNVTYETRVGNNSYKGRLIIAGFVAATILIACHEAYRVSLPESLILLNSRDS